jgi:glycosyltransferase involved in cell wall biosynthesis
MGCIDVSGMAGMSMNRKPRLLFFENNPAYFLSHRARLASELAALGYEVHIATLPGAAVQDIEASGFIHHAVSFSRRGINPIVELIVLWRVLKLYRGLKPDLVYQVTIKPVLYGTMAARWARIRAVISVISGLGFIVTGRGRLVPLLRGFVFLLYRITLRHRHERIIFQNQEDLGMFIGRGLVKPNEALVIPGTGVDTSYFTATEEQPGEPLVILPARMLRDKGVYEFVSAATSLRAAGLQARFQLAGGADPGNPGAISVTQLEQWNSDGYVEWLRHVTDMRSLYARCHIVCLPSYREGMPRVLLEAAASGRPVITTDVPGCRDAVLDEKTGLLVCPGNAQQLAAALRRLIDHQDLRRQMGRAGRFLVESRFSATRVIADTLDVMHTLVRGSQ